MKRALQKLIMALGYEVVPYPSQEWVRCRTILRDILEKLKINCVIDVGANEGQYGKLLREVGFVGWIISFEPIGQVFTALQQIAANDPTWKVFQLALGAENTTAEINVMQGTEFSSFLTPLPEALEWFDHNRIARTERVEVRRLDDVLDACLSGLSNPRLYLKLDAQGSEPEVLKGAERALPRISAIQSEMSFRPIYAGMMTFVETIDTFTNHGFAPVDFLPVTRERGGLCAIEMDCILARRNTAQT